MREPSLIGRCAGPCRAIHNAQALGTEARDEKARGYALEWAREGLLVQVVSADEVRSGGFAPCLCALLRSTPPSATPDTSTEVT